MKANILNTLRSLHNDESGQDLIEYALIAALMATATITAVGSVTSAIVLKFGTIATRLSGS